MGGRGVGVGVHGVAWVFVASRGFSPFLSRSPSSSSSSSSLSRSAFVDFAIDLVFFFWFGTVNVTFQSYYWVWVSFFSNVNQNGKSYGGMILLVGVKLGYYILSLLNVFSWLFVICGEFYNFGLFGAFDIILIHLSSVIFFFFFLKRR